MLDTISREASSSSSRGTTDKVILADEAAEDAVTVTYKIELSCLRVFCPVCPFVEKKLPCTVVHKSRPRSLPSTGMRKCCPAKIENAAAIAS